MAVPPVLLRLAAARDEVLGPLCAAGATAPERAVPLMVDDRAKGRVLRSLLRRGILVEASPGRYYLDETAMARRAGPPVVIAVILGLTALAGMVILALFLLD